MLNSSSFDTSGSQSIDYGFNYEDQDYKHVGSNTSKEVQKNSLLVAAFLGATFTNSFLTILCILFTKCRGHTNIRLFAANLILAQIVQIIYILCSENAVFGFKHILSYQLRSFLDKYILQLQEWTQIVYCGSTSFLIFDFIFRKRNNGVGIHIVKWTILLVLSDLLPLFYIFSKTQFFQYTELMPKPMAVYHALFLLMLTVSFIFLFAAVVCAPFCCADSSMFSQRIDSVSSCQRFSPFTLTRIFLFVLLTIAFQYTGVYMVSMDIAAEMLDTDKAMSMMIKFKGVIEIGMIMNIHKWSTIMRPFFESLAILLFLPSFGDRIFSYVRCSSESKHSPNSLPSSPA